MIDVYIAIFIAIVLLNILLYLGIRRRRPLPLTDYELDIIHGFRGTKEEWLHIKQQNDFAAALHSEPLYEDEKDSDRIVKRNIDNRPIMKPFKNDKDNVL